MTNYFIVCLRLAPVAIAFLLVSIASAHSTVSPSQTFVSKYETFNLSVPTEKTVPTTKIRLVIPESLDRVTPLVKPGWRISIIKNTEGKVREIEWSGGSIPVDQKDIFQFTARTSEEETKLVWKVYQSYQDGEVVAWDQDPNALTEGSDGEGNPYSITDVIEDTSSANESSNSSTSLAFSIIAFVFSLIALSKTSRSN